jgi:twitching motility protein PilT
VARIDPLIAALKERNAPQAAMRPNSPVLIDDGSGRSIPLNDRELTRKQIKMLIDELLSDDQLRFFNMSGSTQVDYNSPVGPVKIAASTVNGELELRVTLPGVQPPAPQPARAPAPQPQAGGGGFDLYSDSGGGAPAAAQQPAPQARPAPAAAAPAAERPAPLELGVQRSIPYVEPGKPAPIDRYLKVMFEEGCSDLHLSSQNPPLYRLDGEIAHLKNMPKLSPKEVEKLVYSIMPDRNYEEFMETRDTDFAYEIEGMGRFRVNAFMDRMGPGAVLRIIPSDILTVEMLDLPQHVIDLCYLSKGLVVVTGPTGSGKSTTLAALIDYINRKRSAHIITIEDPIEFVHPNKKCLINQREIGVHTMGFKPALRAALREDPDIVLVGEMRDLETIAIAMETAETGHLVFGTLHTNTAASTVDRIIDQFPADRQAQIRTMLSESLQAVIAQTLCKKRGGGRVAALEILMCNHAVSNLIREGKTYQIPSQMETKKAEGNRMLNDSLLELVQKKIVDPQEAYIKSVDKANMRRMLERIGARVQFD